MLDKAKTRPRIEQCKHIRTGTTFGSSSVLVQQCPSYLDFRRQILPAVVHTSKIVTEKVSIASESIENCSSYQEKSVCQEGIYEYSPSCPTARTLSFVDNLADDKSHYDANELVSGVRHKIQHLRLICYAHEISYCLEC